MLADENAPSEQPAPEQLPRATCAGQMDPINAYIRLRRGTKGGKGNVFDSGWGNPATRKPEVRPWTRDFQKVKRHAEAGGNLAILTGKRSGNHFTIDVDPRNGGDATLAALEAELGPLPRDNVVETPSGGLHINLSSAGLNFEVGNDTEGKVFGLGIDVKGEYGYRVAPGSTTERGRYVQASGGVAGPYLDPPAWLVERLRGHFADKPQRAAEWPSEGLGEVEKVPVPAECCEAVARAAVDAIAAKLDRLAALPEGKRIKLYGKPVGWDEGCWKLAARLIEIARWPYASVTFDEVKRLYDEHAPSDGDFDPEHAWEQGVANAATWLKGNTHRVEEHGPAVLFDPATDEPVKPRVAQQLDAEEAFWNARPVLAELRDFARARRVSPWALLGCVVARVSASVDPAVVLPPLVGGDGSLNSFVALCGPSGGGKTAAMSAAEDFLMVVGGIDYRLTGVGSGEGLIASFVRVVKGRDGAPDVIEQHNVSTLYFTDEVQSLGALGARTNSTLIPFLKSAWMGQQLATQNAERERNRRVEAHAYRLNVVAGVQPGHADVILSDVSGGFPQRWLWMPTYDPGRLGRDEQVEEPEPYVWSVPEVPAIVSASGRHRMEVPKEVRDAVYTAQEANNRPIGSTPVAATLDGHSVFCREKVAALLALLDGRLDVWEKDWQLAGLVVAKSDQTRAEVVRAHAAEASREADRKAKRQGRSSSIAREVEAEAGFVRVMQNVRKRLSSEGKWVSGSALRRKVRYADREPYFEDAVDQLTESGEVEKRQADYTGGSEGFEYRMRP